MTTPTKHAQLLYDALTLKGIVCVEEAKIGKKHVDIAIHSAHLAIEVDGLYHYTSAKQMVKDLQRDIHSYEDKKYTTIRIPNTAIDSNLDDVVEAIVKLNSFSTSISPPINIKPTLRNATLLLTTIPLTVLPINGISFPISDMTPFKTSR